jgi:hypothetical protein
MDEAGRKLEADLSRIFGEWARSMLPDTAVESIHSYGYAEDGRTLMVMVELADHRLASFSFCPGEPVGAAVHDVEPA